MASRRSIHTEILQIADRSKRAQIAAQRAPRTQGVSHTISTRVMDGAAFTGPWWERQLAGITATETALPQLHKQAVKVVPRARLRICGIRLVVLVLAAVGRTLTIRLDQGTIILLPHARTVVTQILIAMLSHTGHMLAIWTPMSPAQHQNGPFNVGPRLHPLSTIGWRQVVLAAKQG